MNTAAEMKLVHVLLRSGNVSNAQIACRAVLARHPDQPDALRLLGQLLARAGNFGEAVPLLRRAIGHHPTEIEAHHNLVQALIGLGRDDEAVAVLTTALRARAVHVPMTKLLASALHHLGRVYDMRTTLGDAIFRLGATPAGTELIEHWLSLIPDDPAPAHRLAALRGDAPPARAADEYVTYLFDRYAETFDDSLSKLGYHGPALIAQLLRASEMTPNGQCRVLDAGCGTGLCAQIVRPFAEHLTGVDLSSAMIEKARERGGYDELVVAELTEYLGRSAAQFDLIISADTLIYFGDLSALLLRAAHALRPAGWFAFTVEKSDDDADVRGYRLNTNTRYSHSKAYVTQALDAAGFVLRAMNQATIREGDGEPQLGWAVLAQRDSALSSGAPAA
ncbi:MAG: methyltransferase domain-containing protein [Burkholderiales bacterium]|nr:methyltransferase domain-containing protein [Burkholderiales bacterium]